MKLSKEKLAEIFIQMIGYGNYCEKYVTSLRNHIEAIEQELSVKPKFVALNYDLRLYAEKVEKMEPKGFIFEVVERNEKQWKIVSDKYKDQAIHKSHVSEIDINEAFTALKQENLQRLEEVKGLQHKVESLTEYGNKASAHLRKVREDLSKAWATINAEREARVLMEATLERAMLDHQPVMLPKEVAEAIEDFRKSDDPRIITNQYILECHISPNSVTERQKVIRTVPFDTFLTALVNGYTVEQSPEDPAIKEVAGMLNKWTDEDYVSEGSVVDENMKFAEEIVNRVKAFSK